MRKLGRILLAQVLLFHVTLAVTAFLSMDADLGGGAIRGFFDGVIDGYEWVGFGMLPVGVLLVTAAIGLLWWGLVRLGRR